MEKRKDLLVLGRNIGTYTGWDQFDTMIFGFYDFEPNNGVALTKAYCIAIDYEKGLFTYDSTDRHSSENFDLITLLLNIPK